MISSLSQLDRLTTYPLFSFYFHADESSNMMTSEDELEKGNCGDIEVAHACSKTCETLSCTGNTREIVHEVTN